jgi:hypothetical protein
MKIKQSEVIQKLAKLYDSIPEGASSYHICDMLMYKAERLGLITKEEHDEEYYYILQTVIKTDEKNI